MPIRSVGNVQEAGIPVLHIFSENFKGADHAGVVGHKYQGGGFV